MQPSTVSAAMPLRARVAASFRRFSTSSSEMVRVKARPMPKSKMLKMPTRLSAIVNTPQRSGPRSRTRCGVASTATSMGPARPRRFHIALMATVRLLLSERTASAPSSLKGFLVVFIRSSKRITAWRMAFSSVWHARKCGRVPHWECFPTFALPRLSG